jgi:dihydroorotate dehydrogenase
VSTKDLSSLKVSALGLEFNNPLGLAAGFDKNAEVADAMLKLGFSFVEIGSVTPHPQLGNRRPRLFRLPEDQAVINRNGFNNGGLDYVAHHLASLRKPAGGLIGANLGANKDSVDRTEDYVIGFRRLASLSDYVVINISSPNTPRLRDLQRGQDLRGLLARIRKVRDETEAKYGISPPVVLKVAPDLDDEGKKIIAEAVLEYGVDGLIVSNTSITRPDGLRSRHRTEEGGLSGAPLFTLSTRALSDMYKLTGGRVTLIGVGGISTGDHAYAKIRAGATLLQLYTALVYQGPTLITRIKEELSALLERDGFVHISDAVGADHAVY